MFIEAYAGLVCWIVVAWNGVARTLAALERGMAPVLVGGSLRFLSYNIRGNTR
jgi:hypothetical protein